MSRNPGRGRWPYPGYGILHQALDALDKQDAELAENLLLRMFGGLAATEIAELRGVTERTVHRDLELARNYLRLVLGDAA